MKKQEQTPTKTKQPKTISTSLDAFVTNLNSLKLFVDNLHKVAVASDRKRMERVQEETEKLVKLLKKREKSLKNGMGLKGQREFNKEAQEHLKHIQKEIGTPDSFQSSLLMSGSFLLLVSYLEMMISEVLWFYYTTYPEYLTNKEPKLSIGELRKFSSIQEIVQLAVNNEIESLLYQPFNDRLSHIEKLLKVDLSKLSLSWETLHEAIERRHLIIHNNSQVNRRYINAVSHFDLSHLKKSIKEGDRISVAGDYFNLVHQEVYVAGVVLFQQAWQKWYPNDWSKRGSALNDMILNLLKDENWILAERIGEYGISLEYPNESLSLTLKVNYCQSLKWQEKKEYEKIIANIDSSALKPLYLVALAALRGETGRVYELLPEVLADGSITKHDCEQWPLFRELRTDEQFMRTVNQLCKKQSKENAQKTIKKKGNKISVKKPRSRRSNSRPR